MEVTNYVAKMSEGLAVSGMQETVRALNERRVGRLIVCTKLASCAGWQCADCVALYPGLNAKPEQCSHCGSKRIHIADLKDQVIARAYQLGCSIEITTRCPELEQAGGIAALLNERYPQDLYRTA